MRVEYLDHMGDDLAVANAARVSFNKQVTEFTDKEERLIRYLAKHGHMSPFGHCYVKFRVTAPIFVARQLMRHEYLRINEVSRRYVSDEPQFHHMFWRQAAPNVKQGSGSLVTDPNSVRMADYIYQKAMLVASESYDKLLDLGIAPEQARTVLPVSMETTWIWSGSLDAWWKMIRERIADSAQQETQEVATAIMVELQSLYPVSVKYLKEYRL